MESKNPLEDIRTAILESKLFGIENEITQMGVSDELLKISDALDNYYGIDRGLKVNPLDEGHVLNKFNTYTIKPSPYVSNFISSITDSPFDVKKFGKTTDLLKQVITPLKSMKKKLSKDNLIYLSLSSAVVSIALRDVVSSINSYQKPAYYDYKRYDPISGIDNVFSNLVYGGLKVFNELGNFDMTKECFDNYESNRKTILSMANNIQNAMLHPRTSSSNKSGSSGCLVLALTVSTSIVACIGTFLLWVIGTGF